MKTTTNTSTTVTFTYEELIEAFNLWVKDLDMGIVPDVPEGESIGVKILNHILTLVNTSRMNRLTNYNA